MLIKNTMHLQAIVVIDLVIPLFVLPIAIGTFGLSTLGSVFLLQAICQYLIMVGDWGFDANAVTKYVSLNRKRRQGLLYLDIQRVKLLYLVICAPVVIVSAVFAEISFSEGALFFGYMLCFVLQCRWFFLAQGRLFEYSLISLFFRLIFLLYVYFYLNNNPSLFTYLFYSFLPTIALCFYSNFVMWRTFLTGSSPYSIKRQIFRDLTREFLGLFKQGKDLVISRLISNLMSPVFLSVSKTSFSLDFVGVIGLLQKVTGAFVSLITPIIQVCFPLIINKNKISKHDGVDFTNKILSVIFIISLISIISINVFIGYLFEFLSIDYKNSLVILLISLVVFFSSGNTLLTHYLVAIKCSKFISRYTFFGGLSALLFLALSMFINKNQINIAFSMFLVNSITFILLFIRFRMVVKNDK